MGTFGSATILYTGPDGAVTTLRDGDSVSFGGGGSSQLEGGLSADDFVASIEWLAEPQPECVADTRWFVGDLVDFTEPIEGDTANTDGAPIEDGTAVDDVSPEWLPT